MKGFPSLSRSAIPLLLALFLAPPLLADWESEVRLTYNPAHSWFTRNTSGISTAPPGILHVVWKDERDTSWQIYYKRSTDAGSAWSSDIRLTNARPDTSRDPSVAASGSTVHVVWERNWGWDDEIYYKRSTDAGFNWSPDVRLTNSVNESQSPSVAALDSIVHVVWHDNRNFNYEIYYKRSSNTGGTWSLDTRITNTTQGSINPCICVSDSVVHVAWIEGDGEFVNYKHSFDRGVTWDTINTYISSTGYCSEPCISAFGSNVYILWNVWSWPRYLYEIRYNRSTDYGLSWIGDSYLSDGFNPYVCTSGSNVHTFWSYYGNNFYKLSSDAGATWSDSVRFNSVQGGSSYPSATIVDRGLHVVWRDGRDGNFEIYYKRNPTGNSSVEQKSEVTFRPSRAGFRAQPNPFVAFTVVPGHKRERFDLYDISGRLVGTYQGSRVGSDAPPGVYFLKPEDLGAKPFRVVKLR